MSIDKKVPQSSFGIKNAGGLSSFRFSLHFHSFLWLGMVEEIYGRRYLKVAICSFWNSFFLYYYYLFFLIKW